MKWQRVALAFAVLSSGVGGNAWGAVVYPINVTQIGTSTTPARVMISNYYQPPYNIIPGITMYTGSVPLANPGNYSAHVNTIPAAQASANDGNGMLAMYGNTKAPPPFQFNGPNQSVALDVSFYILGNLHGTYNLSPELLKNAEPAPRTVVQPVNLKYNVDVLEQRRLQLANSTIDFGNVLKGGTMSKSVLLNSMNAES